MPVVKDHYTGEPYWVADPKKLRYPHAHRVVICGNREWDDWDAIANVIAGLQRKHRQLIIITGGADGADKIAQQVCSDMGIHCAVVHARWNRYSKRAGPLRNSAMMSLRPMEVIGFHDNLKESKGTKHMLQLAQRCGVRARLWRHK